MRVTRGKSLAVVGALALLGFLIVAVDWSREPRSVRGWFRYAYSRPNDPAAQRRLREALIEQREEWFVDLLELELASTTGSAYQKLYVALPWGLHRRLPPRMEMLVALKSTRHSFEVARALALETNTAPFLKGLEHPRVEVRLATLSMVSGNPATGEALQEKLAAMLHSTRDEQAQFACAFALSEMRQADPETVSALIAYTNGSPFTSLKICEALARFTTNREVWLPRLTNTLALPEVQRDPPPLRYGLALAAKVTNKPPELLGILRQLCNSPNELIREEAQKALQSAP